MSGLNAFVGHSFTKEDEDVVRSFLTYFDKIKEMGIGFDWVHAEGAQPEELANKVLSLAKGRNLFIGICTRKEAAISQDKLKSGGFFRKSVLQGEERDFSSKTSDWIIQESGLAVGLGMKLIILLEEGVRKPGGLQGDLEYIQFNRVAPEKAYLKILEMIQSRLPKVGNQFIKQVESDSVSEEKKDSDESSSKWLEPQPDWKRKEFSMALHYAIILDDEKQIEKIRETYLADKEGNDNETNSWIAYCESRFLMIGKNGSLAKLEGLAKQYPDNSDIQLFLGNVYNWFEQYPKAVRSYKISAENVDGDKRLISYGKALEASTRSGDSKESTALIDKMKILSVKYENGETLLTDSLIKVADIKQDDDSFFTLMEYYLELHPDDNDKRFQLAYRYSQIGQHEELSLVHYLKIQHQERTAITWNNLGVQFDHFDLPGKSVNAYRIAEEQKETLAMDNLVRKFIGAGFFHEAEELCNEAMKIDDFHKNIGHSITTIKNASEDEEKKQKKIIQNITPLRKYFSNYGCALLKPAINTIHSEWRGPKCKFNLTIDGDRFLAHGDYEVKKGTGLLGALGGRPLGSANATEVNKYRISYDGKISGLTIRCKKVTEHIDKPPENVGWLSKGNPSVEAFMIISEDFSEIKVYEKSDAVDSEFYSLLVITEKSV